MLKLILLLTLTTTAFAQDYNYTGKFGLGAGFGYNWPAFENSFNEEAEGGYLFDLHARYHFAPQFSTELAFSRHEFADTKKAFQILDLTGIYRFKPVSRFSPIAGLGIGLADVTRNAYSGYNITGKLRAGVEYSFIPSLVGGFMVDYEHVTKIITTRALDNGGAHVFSPKVQLTWYFGMGSKPAEVAPVRTAPVKEDNGNKDDDRDGVVNRDDKCPQTPRNTKVNNYGCAAQEKAIVKININFATGKSEVEPLYHYELQHLATFMRANPKSKIEIQGHTDSAGSHEVNRKLSNARANSVREYMIKKFESDGSKLTAKGYGEDKPITSNSSDAGKAQNRRVVAEISE